MSRAYKRLRRVCRIPFEWLGITQKCMRDLEKVIRRHPSCWVLNYNYFRKHPTEAELAKLEEKLKEFA